MERRAAAARPPERTSHRQVTDVPVDAYLGIDIGSVSTNLVVIDAAGRGAQGDLPAHRRAADRGRRQGPARDRARRSGDRIRIRGVGTTGSGRELIARAGRRRHDQRRDHRAQDRRRVHRQDAPRPRRGHDLRDRRAGRQVHQPRGRHRRGLHDERGLRRRHGQLPRGAGAGAGHPDRGGVRGAGALEPSPDPSRRALHRVHGARRQRLPAARGAALEDLVAGLAYSVATNYINRVVRGRKIGETIFLQGGTAYNDAVAAALSAVVGKRIIVPPFNGVMGALGVALLARDKMLQPQQRRAQFRGYAPHEVDCETLEFTCRGCTNYCQMQRVTVEGQHTYWGDKCSVRYRKAARGRARAGDRGPRRVPAVEAARRLRARGRSSGAGDRAAASACRPTTGRRSGSRCSASSACACCSRSRPETTS